MDDTRRYRLNAAECLLAAKTCRSDYREIILSISACWHLLARQDEAMNTLLANWTRTVRDPACVKTLRGINAP
jgi:hypothetical protein